MYSRAMPAYPAQHTDAAETLLAERADGADRGLRNAPYARGEPRLESGGPADAALRLHAARSNSRVVIL